MGQKKWETHNPAGSRRVIVTKELPGTLWLQRLTQAGCKVEVCTSTDVLSVDEIDKLFSAIDLSTPEGMRNRAMLETIYSSGLRVSELINLKLNNIYYDIGFLRIFGKGSKERLVPIGREAMKFVKIYVKEVRVHLVIQPGNESYAFLNRRGTRLMLPLFQLKYYQYWHHS